MFQADFGNTWVGYICLVASGQGRGRYLVIFAIAARFDSSLVACIIWGLHLSGAQAGALSNRAILKVYCCPDFATISTVSMHKVDLTIGEDSIQFYVNSSVEFGKSDAVLLLEDENLIADMPWTAEGYSVEKFLEESDYLKFESGIVELIRRRLRGLFPETDFNNFQLKDYHKFITTDEMHQKFTNSIQPGFSRSDFPVALELVEKRISQILVRSLTSKCWIDGRDVFYLRFVRPLSKVDNNPPHRDVWLDYLRHCVNIYVPLSGSGKRSALPILPGSHLWPESEVQRSVSGAELGIHKYRVPAVTGFRTKRFHLVRPNPGRNEMTVFSPYLVHGGGSNLEDGETRVSLEMRFWSNKKVSH